MLVLYFNSLLKRNKTYLLGSIYPVIFVILSPIYLGSDWEIIRERSKRRYQISYSFCL